MPKPKEAPEPHGPVDGTSYMCVRSQQKQGDTYLYQVLRVTLVAGTLTHSEAPGCRPMPRLQARDRLIVLNGGRDVLP